MRRKVSAILASGLILGACSAENPQLEANRDRYDRIVKQIGRGGVWMLNGGLYGPNTDTMVIRPIVNVGTGEQASAGCDNVGSKLEVLPDSVIEFFTVYADEQSAIAVEGTDDGSVQTISRAGRAAIECVAFNEKEDVFVNGFPVQANFGDGYLDVARAVVGGVETIADAELYLGPQVRRK